MLYDASFYITSKITEPYKQWTFVCSNPSPSSSSLVWWSESLSLSEDAVSMKTNPMKREVFSGRGPCVATRSLGSGGRSTPLPDVLQAARRCPVEVKQKQWKHNFEPDCWDWVFNKEPIGDNEMWGIKNKHHSHLPCWVLTNTKVKIHLMPHTSCCLELEICTPLNIKSSIWSHLHVVYQTFYIVKPDGYIQERQHWGKRHSFGFSFSYVWVHLKIHLQIM